jgi:excinuclease ABC subunit C
MKNRPSVSWGAHGFRIVYFSLMETVSAELSKQLRDLPHRPGVYLFRDRFHRVVYVGKAKDLHRRVGQYFHPSRKFGVDLKTRALLQSIAELETHVVKSEPESILLEGRLIKEYRPRYNVSFRDDKRFLLVRVDLAEPYPRFQMTRMKNEDQARYFGPFAHSGALRQTLSLIRKKFGLRSCRPASPGEKDYRHCMDDVIRNCSAPCVGKITQEAYGERVRLACEFMEGKTLEMRESLEEAMVKAAGRKDFEKAASLRNLVEDLKKTTRPTRKFFRSLPSTVVPEKDLETLRDALGLAVVPAHIECFDISNISDTHSVASMVVFRDGRPAKEAYRRFRIQGVQGQDDVGCMAEVIRRRCQRLKLEGQNPPDLMVVDGGKGQLGAAVRELKLVGWEGVPAIGLAKQNEEIFRPGRPDPLVLPHESGAIRLLQRVRDEAHRVANGYHQLLMKKRMEMSELDSIPGVSGVRKRALLKKFGTVGRVAKASVEELSEVEGVGEKVAAVIAAYFVKG